MNLLIQNGHLICPTQNLDRPGDLWIIDGKIASIDTPPPEIPVHKTIDALNQWVMPGCVDLCARISKSHPHHTGSVQSEVKAATARGITALCCPPDALVPLDTPSAVQSICQQSHEMNMAHVYPMGALSQNLQGEQIADHTALMREGCIGVSNGKHAISDWAFLRNCYLYAAGFDLTVVIHPMCPWLSKGVVNAGRISDHLGLAPIPSSAETIPLAGHLALVEETGVKAHFSGITTSSGVSLIAQAKAKGLPISADTTMHALHLTDMDVSDFNPMCHVIPPLRSEGDQLSLVKALKEGVIDAICSDHTPLDLMAKSAPFSQTIPGISALDTYLSLGIHLVHKNIFSPLQLVSAMCERPAQLFKLPQGRLTPGSMADLIILDPNHYWHPKPESLYSKGKNTPFLNWELPGIVNHTFTQNQLYSWTQDGLYS